MKPLFIDINYDPRIHYQPRGNQMTFLAPIAHIITDQEKYAEKHNTQMNAAEEIYNKYINVGQVFRPSGEGANIKIICKIIRINPKTNTISWRQINNDTDLTSAKGKWPIASMIYLIKAGSVSPVDKPN